MPFTVAAAYPLVSALLDRSMSNERRDIGQILLPATLAAATLLIAGYLVMNERMSDLKELGFLAGLFSGFVSFSAGAMRKKMSAPTPWLRAIELLFCPFAFLLLLPLAVSFAGGFFMGGVASFCISWAATGVVAKD